MKTAYEVDDVNVDVDEFASAMGLGEQERKAIDSLEIGKHIDFGSVESGCYLRLTRVWSSYVLRGTVTG